MEGVQKRKRKGSQREKWEMRGDRKGEDKQRVKDEFPGGSVKLYWCVSLSLIVSLSWL